MKNLIAFLALSASVVGCGESGTSSHVTFSVDLRDAIDQGVFDPTSDRVGVRGSVRPLSWDQSVMAQDLDDDGVYETEVVFERSPEPVRYKFKIEHPGRVNEGWEQGRDRLTDRSGARSTVERPFDEPLPPLESTLTGDIRIMDEVGSAYLNRNRRVWVYLPPGYESVTSRYPVLYMNDGQHLFDAVASGFEWSADEAAEELISNGEIEPVIIVGVGSSDERVSEYTPTSRQARSEYRRRTGGPGWEGQYATISAPPLPLNIRVQNSSVEVLLPYEADWDSAIRASEDTLLLPQRGITFVALTKDNGRVETFSASRPDEGGRGEAYGRFLLEELKPMIDAAYRTDPSRTSLGGASLGGLITVYLGAQYPGRFEGLLVASPSVWWDDRSILEIAADADLGETRVWIDVGSGENGSMVPDALDLYETLLAGTSDPSRLRYLEARGATHHELAWAARFPDMLRFLYGD